MIFTAPPRSRSRPTTYVAHRKILPLDSAISWCIRMNLLFLFVLMYPLFFAGIIYDVIVEPPSIGSTTDERGNSKPVSRPQEACSGGSTSLTLDSTLNVLKFKTSLTDLAPLPSWGHKAKWKNACVIRLGR